MKSKNLLTALFGLLLVFLFCGACVSSTYAGGIGYSTGGNASSGGGGVGGWVNYDCTLNLLQAGWYQGQYLDDEGAVGNGKYYCPHWIKITGEDYKYLLEKKYMVGKYSGLDTCANDDYVVISGNYRNPDYDYGDGYHGIVIQNFTDETTMLNLHYVGKTTHTIMSVANDVSTKKGYTSVVSYKANGSMSAGFFGENAGTIGGKEYTYGELLSEVLTTYKLKEIDVASFCLSSINEEYDLDVEGRNIYDNTALTSGDIKPAASGDGDKEVTRKKLNADGYRFICWKDSTSSGKKDCITDTDSSSDPYVSDLSGGSYTKYHKNLSEDHTVYAYYAPMYKLSISAGTGTSITVERKSNTYAGSDGNLSDDSAIYKDDKLKICLTVDSGYTLKSFTIKSGTGSATDISPNGKYCTDTSSSQFTVNADTAIVAEATRDEFYGKSLVSSSNGQWSSSNGVSVGANNSYTQESGSQTYYINNCDPIVGCTAKFWHYLKRGGGGGSTTYSIKRSSNYDSVSSVEVISKKTESFGSGAEVKLREESFTNKLKPGQVVCESLTFDAGAAKGEKTLTVCAAALGNAQPPDPENPDGPEGDKSFLNLQVKNNDVSKYKDYQRSVYAKPGDTVNFRAIYNPVLQYTYNLRPEKIKVDSGSVIRPATGRNTTSRMHELYNNNKSQLGSGLKNWNNAFSIDGSVLASPKTYSYTLGDTTRQEAINSYEVKMDNVGTTLSETARTNAIDAAKTTPSQVKFNSESIGGEAFDVGNIITTPKNSVASVVVPYNYENTTSISNNDNETMYAGETFTLKYKYIVSPRTNNLTTNSTSEKYATGVPNPQWRVKIVVNGEEILTSVVDMNDDVLQKVSLNEIGVQRSSDKQTSFIVPDVPAGTTVCVASMIYPANSGGYDSLNMNGSNTWTESELKCFKVAKKPNLQVWGGGVYSSGKIQTTVSAKKHLAGVNAYSPDGKNDYHVFGSWGELEVVSLGAVTGFASGASTGYPMGSVEKSLNFCVRSVLTFANENCSRGGAGVLGGSSQETVKKNRDDLIAELRNGQSRDNIQYNEVVGDVTVGGDEKPSVGATKIIKAEGTIIINGNIDFLDSYSYSTIEDVPKLVLYANNIKINCEVTRVDAVLIAENDVDTCGNANGADINSSIYSNQLRINGAVIANTLTARRTYGASTGEYSIIPAEVINYDSTLYLWGTNNTSITKTGKLTTTYLREAAPRY